MDFRNTLTRGWRYLCHAGPMAQVRRLGVVIVIAALLAAGQGLYELYSPDDSIPDSLAKINGMWLLACVVTVAGIVVTTEFFWLFVIGPRAAKSALQAALKMTVRSLDLGPEANARVTVYVAGSHRGPGPRMLYQEFPYVYAHSEERRYGLGATGISESVGIVGRVFRIRPEPGGLATFVPNDDPTTFVKLLVEDWGFSQETAQKVDRERASYMVFCFSRPGRRGKTPLEGVVYFDAKGASSQFDEGMIVRVVREQLGVIVSCIAQYYGVRE